MACRKRCGRATSGRSVDLLAEKFLPAALVGLSQEPKESVTDAGDRCCLLRSYCRSRLLSERRLRPVHRQSGPKRSHLQNTLISSSFSTLPSTQLQTGFPSLFVVQWELLDQHVWGVVAASKCWLSPAKGHYSAWVPGCQYGAQVSLCSCQRGFSYSILPGPDAKWYLLMVAAFNPFCARTSYGWYRGAFDVVVSLEVSSTSGINAIITNRDIVPHYGQLFYCKKFSCFRAVNGGRTLVRHSRNKSLPFCHTPLATAA